MKKTITLALGLLTLASVAQYNSTYDINANSDNLTPSFVITNKKAESITVSYASDGPTTPRTDYFILTKHDQYGNVVYNNRIDPFNATDDGLTNVEALIQTDDEGVLVAGYHYDDSKMIEQPFLLKVDVLGDVQWVKLYYMNKKPIVNSQLNKISLCRVYDDPSENYFIVGNGDSDYQPGKDVATTVIKVDNTGKLIFANKYYNTIPTQFNVVRDYPGDIEFSKPDKMYMITGFRQDVNSSNVSSKVMYYLGINSAGNVVTKFMTLTSKSTPIDQDMIFDPNEKVFVTVFTHEKSSYIPGMNSQIGFITVDAILNIANPKFLWHKYGSDHNGRSISLSNSGEYILCSGTLDNYSTFTHNPALQKVDVTGMPTSAYYRYNVDDEVIFGHHANSFNTNGDEEYVMVNLNKDDLRVIRTDVNAKACGEMKYEPYVEKYDPKQNFYTYKPRTLGAEKDYKVYEKKFFPRYRECENDASSYRTTGISVKSSNETNIALFPTVMSISNANLSIENNSGSVAKMEVRSISGQLILMNDQLSAGKTEVNLNQTGNLAIGMYLVKVYSADGSLNHISKILITQ